MIEPKVLDLGPILADYTEKRRFPPDGLRLMVRLLIYGYTNGVRSSRAFERKCVDGVAFRDLTTGAGPGLPLDSHVPGQASSHRIWNRLFEFIAPSDKICKTAVPATPQA